MKFIFKKSLNLFAKINALIITLIAQKVSAYEFQKDSGLINTGEGAGFDTISLFSINTIITLILPFLGTVYLLLMIWAGYIWMMAQGNEEQVRKAKKIIINSTIALALVLLAYAISYYVVSYFQVGLVQGT